MNAIKISRSKRKGKKLVAEFSNGKTVHFGAAGYSDFTIHKDPERKKRYLDRHQHDPTSITTAGGLSRDVLWSKPTLKEAVNFAEKKHGLRIHLDGNLLRRK